MTTRECAIEIKNFIEQTYECIFAGKVEVIALPENTFNLRLTLNSFYVPLNITMQGNIEEFLEYVKDELKKKRLNVIEYYSGYKDYPRESYNNNIGWSDDKFEEIISDGYFITEDEIIILTENNELIYNEQWN